MPKTKEQKGVILRNLDEKIKNSKSIVFANFNALSAKSGEALRNELKKENSEYYVAKKTLLNKALVGKGLEEIDVKNFEGKLAAIFGYEDEVAPAKVVDKFMKTNADKIQFVGGFLENKFLSSFEVSQLAKLPSKQELYAKIVGSLNAPISGFVNVLGGSLKKLLYVLKAIEEKKA